MSVRVAEGVIEVTADADKVPGDIRRAMDRGAPDLDRSGRRGGGAVLAGLGAALAIGGLIKLGQGIGDAISAGVRGALDFTMEGITGASDLNEVRNAVGEVFGDSAASVEAFASTANRVLGQTQAQALNGAKSFGVLGKSGGLAGEDLASFSTEMVTLASDLASFNNTTPEEAILAIGSALRGEAEPIRSYGVMLDDATLKNRAMELGLIRTTKEALTPQQKVLAAQAEILAQTSDQQGDFTRTSGDLSNQQRILAASFEESKARLGEALLPAMNDLMTFANDNLVPALNDLIDEVGPELAAAVEESLPMILELAEELMPLIPILLDLAINALPGVIWAIETIVPLLIDWAEHTSSLFDIVDTFFRWLNGDATLEEVAESADNAGGSFFGMARNVGQAIVDGMIAFHRFSAGVHETIGGAIGFVLGIPGRVRNALSGIGRTLYNSGRSLIQGFIDGIRGMIGNVTGAVGGIMDTVASFFPNSPARQGPFSGSGWSNVASSGEALLDQFRSRMDGRIELGLDTGSAAIGARSLAARRAERGAGGGQNITVQLSQTIQATDPILGARQAAREVTRFLGVA